MSIGSRRTTLIAAGIALATTLAACSGGSGGSGTSPADPSHPAGHTTSSTTSSTPSSTPTTPAASPQQIRAHITSELHSIITKQPGGSISVAALNTSTGQRFSDGRKSGMWTASAYKLFCLSAILIGRSASALSSSEVESAEEAIENSNNVAGYQLFLDAGGRPGLIDAARTFGMHHTVPGESDPTFTTTSGTDYLKLLEAVTGRTKNDPLDPSARHFILNLMGEVEADQRWGIGSAAEKGTKFYNKNGWLSIQNGNGPGEDDNGLWAVTSVGVLTVAHQRVLMAVFTRHQSDYDTGVALVNRLSKLIAPAVAR